MNKLSKLVVFLLVFVMIIFSNISMVFAENIVNTNNASTSNLASASSSASASTNGSSTATLVSSVDTNDHTSASLDLSNIINILLIAVGIVLILLAVAILIRLKD